MDSKDVFAPKTKVGTKRKAAPQQAKVVKKEDDANIPGSFESAPKPKAAAKKAP